jgi:hypothetical protein
MLYKITEGEAAKKSVLPAKTIEIVFPLSTTISVRPDFSYIPQPKPTARH